MDIFVYTSYVEYVITCTCSIVGRQAKASNAHILGPERIQTVLERVDWWSLFDRLRKPVPVSDNGSACALENTKNPKPDPNPNHIPNPKPDSNPIPNRPNFSLSSKHSHWY